MGTRLVTGLLAAVLVLLMLLTIATAAPAPPAAAAAADAKRPIDGRSAHAADQYQARAGNAGFGLSCGRLAAHATLTHRAPIIIIAELL